MKEKHNLSKGNLEDMLKYLKNESTESGKYQKMRQNLKRLRAQVQKIEM